ncbi:MAG TPA: YdeI/OmpD-associated family protein [Flavobacteriaceae bacterium]|nr:YdeI/OmpD-associated family protein [Flavobacteriaceae bacterium]
MIPRKELEFTERLEIIGINPFVFLPKAVLKAIFDQAEKSTSPIPVKGTVNGKPYRQNLMKFKGEWRLYINLQMLENSPRRIGETLKVTIIHNPEKREIPIHPKLSEALNKTPQAKIVFEKLPPSRRKEIIRYISNLKTEKTIDRNVERAIGFLLVKGRFVGREKP